MNKFGRAAIIYLKLKRTYEKIILNKLIMKSMKKLLISLTLLLATLSAGAQGFNNDKTEL